MTTIYRGLAQKVEVYSIDECFLSIPDAAFEDMIEDARHLRATAMRWTGIPVSVGVATTKTLAKLANQLAKRVPANAGEYVLTTPGVVTGALSSVELTDLWGVTHGFARRLTAIGIHFPLELRDADPSRVREQLGVMGQRIVLYHEFAYRAATWNRDRRVVAKVEWHRDELFPRENFIVTNMGGGAASVTWFYNGRDTAEQYIEGGQDRPELDTALLPRLRE